MKYDSLQETFRYVTPGLFFLALIIGIHFGEIQKNQTLIKAVSQLSALIILLIPFVGFVAGYLIECVMTWVERFLYLIKIPRPSRIVLCGSSSLYYLDEKTRVKILNGVYVNDNKIAGQFQQKAKQVVGDNAIVSRCYYQSIMARHIWGAFLFVCVYYLAFCGGWSWRHLICVVLVLLLLSFFWYHQTCVYMKYLFAEYGKAINSNNNENNT